jgi:predicted transcriptional regulator
MNPAATTARPDELLAELGRAWEQFAAAERRARTYLAREGVLDQTDREVRSLLRELAASGNSPQSPSV